MNKETAEVIYWVVAVVLILVVPPAWKAVREYHETRLFDMGKREAQKWMTEGITPASVHSFLKVQRENGLYGRFEAGVESAVREVKA